MPLPKNAKLCENCLRWSSRLGKAALDESSLAKRGRSYEALQQQKHQQQRKRSRTPYRKHGRVQRSVYRPVRSWPNKVCMRDHTIKSARRSEYEASWQANPPQVQLLRPKQKSVLLTPKNAVRPAAVAAQQSLQSEQEESWQTEPAQMQLLRPTKKCPGGSTCRQSLW